MIGGMSGLGGALHRVARLIRKEFWQLRRDATTSLLLVGLPVMLQLLVVNVVGQGGSSVSAVAVIDHDVSPLSRSLIAAIDNTGEARVQLRMTRLADANAALSAGEITGIVVIPPGFERALATPNRQTELLAVVDGTNLWESGRTLAAISGAVGRFAEDMARVTGRSPGLQLRSTRYDAITRIQDPVSSQFGFLLYQVVLMVSGMGLAREREMGTLEQLLVTPLSRFEMILGKTMPALLVGVADFWLLWLSGTIIWGVPTRGSLALLFGLGVLFILAESAWGLFLTSPAVNQQQATQLVFVQILVDMAFCGYIVPVQNLPRFLSWFSELLPLRHYLECVRIVMLRGGGIADVSGHLAALLGLNAFLWLVTVQVMHRRLE